MQGLSLVAASGGHSSSRCAGLSLSRPLLLRSTGSRRAGSVIVSHGPNCSAARGIFPDQGSNPYPLHWQADSQPLRHQGSPFLSLLMLPLFLPPVETCSVPATMLALCPEVANRTTALSDQYHSYPCFTYKETTAQRGSVTWQRFYEKPWSGIQSGTQKQARLTAGKLPIFFSFYLKLYT